MIENPDEVKDHVPAGCGGCGQQLSTEDSVGHSRRQVRDIPLVTVTVTEHRAHRCRCGGCGRVTSADMPATVAGAPSSYGPNLRAPATYLLVFQHVPVERCAQLIADFTGARVSPGWVSSILAEAAALVAGSINVIRALLTLTHVLHVDETTTRIGAARRWLHVACTNSVTLLGLGERSRQGANSLGVLPEFRGVLVHDSLSLYNGYPRARHQLCGAHLVRELTAAAEDHPGQRWPAQIRWALAELNKQAIKAREARLTDIPPDRARIYLESFHRGIAVGLSLHPRAPGRKQSPARNLLQRLQDRAADVLRFADFPGWVPFTNNMGERALRPVKTQVKISGCHQSEDGAAHWLTVRSYLDSARKHGLSPSRRSTAPSPATSGCRLPAVLLGAEHLLDRWRRGRALGVDQFLEHLGGPWPLCTGPDRGLGDQRPIHGEPDVGESQRIGVVRLLHVLKRRHHVLRGRAEPVGVVARRDPRGHPLEVRVSGLGPGLHPGVPPVVGRGDAVQPHPVHLAGEEAAQHRAEPGAPGAGEEADLRLAQRGADPVDVTGHVRGRDLFEEFGIRLGALPVYLDRLGVGLPGVFLGDWVRRAFAPLTFGARDFRTGADASRVDSDQVVALVQLRPIRDDPVGHQIAGPAGAPGVERQAAPTVFLVSRLQPGQGDADLLARRVVIVQGNADRPALGTAEQLPVLLEFLLRHAQPAQVLVGVFRALLPLDGRRLGRAPHLADGRRDGRSDDEPPAAGGWSASAAPAGAAADTARAVSGVARAPRRDGGVMVFRLACRGIDQMGGSWGGRL
ncbi:IS66 family transposase [Nonomuraea diastatica]|uniref:IS66 family transposase n=1 Tax=Nonomuraea diastatica TaxID=1848329 RepID=A0A4R4VQS7_9ACTN|nr:IS66 family transposase [Nonomuraea diastatica]